MAIYKREMSWLQLILQRLKDYRNSMPVESIERSAMAHEIIWLETRIRQTLGKKGRMSYKSEDELHERIRLLAAEVATLKRRRDNARKEQTIYNYHNMKAMRTQMRRLARRLGTSVNKVQRLRHHVSNGYRRSKEQQRRASQEYLAGGEYSQEPKHEGVRSSIPDPGVSVSRGGSTLPNGGDSKDTDKT